MRQLNNLNGAIEVEEKVVAWVVCTVAGIDNGINLVRPGKTVGSVQLVHRPPGSKPTSSQPQEQGYDHANTKNEQPMHSPFGWWLAMDNNSSVSLLNDSITRCVNIPPRAGRHTSTL